MIRGQRFANPFQLPTADFVSKLFSEKVLSVLRAHYNIKIRAQTGMHRIRKRISCGFKKILSIGSFVRMKQEQTKVPRKFFENSCHFFQPAIFVRN